MNTVVRELEVTEYFCGWEKNALRVHRWSWQARERWYEKPLCAVLREHEWDNGGDGKSSSSRVWQSGGRLRKASILDSALSPYHIFSFSAALLLPLGCFVFPGEVLRAGSREDLEAKWRWHGAWNGSREDGCFLNCSGPFEAAFLQHKLSTLIHHSLAQSSDFISKVPGEKVTEIHRNITIKYPFSPQIFYQPPYVVNIKLSSKQKASYIRKRTWRLC